MLPTAVRDVILSEDLQMEMLRDERLMPPWIDDLTLTVTCRHCGQEGLRWVSYKPNGPRFLVGADGDRMHRCGLTKKGWADGK
jgi:hypothetical protein